MDDDAPVWSPCATAFSKEPFLILQSLAGYASKNYDPQGLDIDLRTDADETQIAEAVLACLAASRQVEWNDPVVFPQTKELKLQRYKEWKAMLTKRHGFKSATAFFKDLKCCELNVNGDSIHFLPTAQIKNDHWGMGKSAGLSDDDNVVIPKDSSPAQITAALWKAFANCR